MNNGAHKRLALHVRLGCGSLSITTPVSLLVNELDGRSVLHGQVPIEIFKKITDKGQLQYFTKLKGPQEGTYLYTTQFLSLR